ncbi:MAG: hypothetical protein LBD18_05840 [Treponema sp.]|nr:hypothetical protein [Treponema sp.]
MKQNRFMALKTAALALLFGLTIAACGGKAQAQTGGSGGGSANAQPGGTETASSSAETANKPKDKSIDDLLAFFRDSGIAVSETSKISPYSVLATDGREAKLDGALVHIYQYDAANERGKSILQDTEKTGILAPYGDRGFCRVRGAFIITSSGINNIGQAEKEKIASVFQKF